MNFTKLPYFIAFVVLISSCNQDESVNEPGETCLEGWELYGNTGEISYEKCPQTDSECNIYLKVGMDVGAAWKDGAGLLIIRNIEKGYIEEFKRELPIYSHRLQIKMSFDRSHDFTHEVTLELPTNGCEINGQLYSYTYAFDTPCDSFVDISFKICPD